MTDNTPWEYRVKTFGGILKQTKDEDLQEALDEWGEDGWEVVAVATVENSNALRIIAKRPLTNASRRRRSMPI